MLSINHPWNFRHFIDKFPGFLNEALIDVKYFKQSGRKLSENWKNQMDFCHRYENMVEFLKNLR